MGSAHPNIAPYGTPYDTADGPPIVLAVGTDRQFNALCDVLDCPGLADVPDFATNEQRVAHREALQSALAKRIQQREHDALLAALEERNVPAGTVRDIPTVFDQSTARAMAVNASDGPAGLRQTTFPHPNDADSSLSPPPHYGEYTTLILRDRLGYSADRIAALQADGVVTDG